MRLTLRDMEELLHRTLVPLISDVEERETTALVSSFIVTFGLAEFGGSSADGPRTHFEGLSPCSFDFQHLRRDSLVRAADASTGLGQRACEAAISAIEERVCDETAEHGALDVEQLGRITMNLDKTLTVHLHESTDRAGAAAT